MANSGEGLEKREPSYIVGGDINWCNCCGKHYGGLSKELKQKNKTLKIELPYDPAILLLGVYPDKTIIEKIHVPAMLMQALVAQLCLTLCSPMDCSPPGSSVHGILQARILEWVAIPFSRGSS